MFNPAKEIPKRLRELGQLFSFREIIVKDINELEEINNCFKGECNEMITKYSHIYRRDYGDSMLIMGVKFSYQTTEELAAENLRLKEKSKQDVATIRTLLSELYKKNYTPKEVKELMGR